MACCTVSASHRVELLQRPLAPGEILDEEEAALPRTDETEIAVAVDVHDGNLHPATHAAAVVDQVADPLDSAISRGIAPAALRSRAGADRCRTMFVPVDA